MSKMQAWDADRAQARIRELEHLPGALLPILHALQEEFGYIDPDATPLIAERAESLARRSARRHQFLSRFSPRAARKACPADLPRRILPVHGLRRADPACREDGWALSWVRPRPIGSLTVEQVFCLGNCALSPAVMLDGEPYGRVSPSVADFLIDSARRARR